MEEREAAVEKYQRATEPETAGPDNNRPENRRMTNNIDDENNSKRSRILSERAIRHQRSWEYSQSSTNHDRERGGVLTPPLRGSSPRSSPTSRSSPRLALSDDEELSGAVGGKPRARPSGGVKNKGAGKGGRKGNGEAGGKGGGKLGRKTAGGKGKGGEWKGASSGWW